MFMLQAWLWGLLALALIAAIPASPAVARSEITPDSWWAGLWKGEQRSQRGTIHVSVFVGQRSWVEIGRCRGALQPLRLEEKSASFTFAPESRTCPSAGKLTLTAQPVAIKRRSRQDFAQLILRGEPADLNVMVAKPVTEITRIPYRFFLDTPFERFVWTAPKLPILEAAQFAVDKGYRCLNGALGRLSPDQDEYTFAFETKGNVTGGYLFLMTCKGQCEGVTFTLGSSINVYAQYLGNQFGTPAVFFESKTFFARTHRVTWQLPVDFKTGERVGQAHVFVGVFSRDPAEYGPGC